MVQRFIDFARSDCNLAETDRIIVAVSGGIDSMVLAHLFIEAGIRPAIAHCNFCLRNAESDGDEEFVRSFASRFNLQFFVKKFDTSGYAAGKKISIQMAARELRYNWFEEIRQNYGFDSIAVAHNLNDNVETFFINLIRGTGINGLTGMSPVNGKIIRPLLFATREAITEYAGINGIIFREDSSNASDKYLRNKIRHKVIPLLEELNKEILHSISLTMGNLQGSAEINSRVMNELRDEIFITNGDDVHVDLEKLERLTPLNYYLFELFKPYGLTPDQTGELSELIAGSPGRMLYTSGKRIVKDRNELIITAPELINDQAITFSTLNELKNSKCFRKVLAAEVSDIKPESDPETAFLDADMVTYPLTFRRWEPGDRFMPLGMNGMKKISDFLIDKKIPVTEKERVMVLLSGDEIAWVAGYRIDNRYRITDKTISVLVISL